MTKKLMFIGFIAFILLFISINSQSVEAGVQNNIWYNLTLYWTSDENTTWDNSTYGQEGSERGTPSFVADTTMVGSGHTVFDVGSSDAITFAPERFDSWINFTAGCWITSAGDSDTPMRLLGQYDGIGAQENNWNLWNDDRSSQNTLALYYWDAEGDFTNLLYSPDSIIEGGHKNWFGIIVNQTNGILAVQMMVNATVIAEFSIASAISQNDINLTIGGKEKQEEGEGWGGKIDECIVVNMSLTTTQLQHIINNGTAGKTLGPEEEIEVDTTPPVINVTNKNITLKLGDVWNITAFITGTATTANITYNLTGETNKYNFSFALTGDIQVISQNITIDLTRGAVINATVTACDASNNCALNSTKITIGDTVGTITQGLNITSIKKGNVNNVSCNVTDIDGDVAFISIGHNQTQTGLMVNTSFAVSGFNPNASLAIETTLVRGGVINYSCFYNDTAGTVVQSSSKLSVGNTPPIITPPTLLKLQTANISNLKDTFVLKQNPYANRGTDEEIRVAPRIDRIERTYIMFDMTQIINNTTIFNATLFLKIGSFNQWDSATDTYRPFEVFHVLNTTWNEFNMTWNTSICGTTTGSTRGNCNATAEDSTQLIDDGALIFRNWSVTSAVKREFNNLSTNNITLMVRDRDEDVATSPTNHPIVSFHSKEYSTDITLRPILTIGYGGIYINDTTRGTNVDLGGTVRITDADGDAQSGTTYKWYKNGAIIAGQTTINLASSNFVVGDYIIFEATPNDGINAGSPVNSSPALIVNLVPSTPTIILPTVNDYNNTQPDYPFNIIFEPDADGDALTIYYYINGVLNQTSATNTTFNASDGYYILNVSLYDGIDFSPNATVTFTIDTILPVIQITLNNTSPRLNQLINIFFNVTDINPLSFVNVTINFTTGMVIKNYTITGDSTLVNITKITDNRGNVLNISVCSLDVATNYGCNSTKFTVANTPPLTPTIILPTPDDYNNTQPNYPFKVTFEADADEDPITILWYINGLLNQSTTTNTTFNASDGYYILNVSLSDGYGSSPNATINFTIDTTFPTLLKFNLTNNTRFNFNTNITINITIQDNNPFNLSYNLHNATEDSLQFAYNDAINSSTTISIVDTLNLTGLASGNYTLDINFSDRHTKTEIDDYVKNRISEGFNFKTAEGNDITIVQTFGNKADRLESIKKIDRYTIEYGTTENRETRQFLITADSPIKIISGTQYKGHLIIGNKNWMDFQNGDSLSEVTITRLGENMVLVSVFSNDFNFDSIGGLNNINIFYNFQVDNDPPYFGEGTINNTSPDTNEVVSLSQLCGDLIALSTCFLAHNQSGSFINVTNTTVSNTTNEFNQTLNITITGLDGATVGLQACANDTFNQFSCSGFNTFQINDDTPPIINGTTNVTVFYQGESINATFNVTDTLALEVGQIIITEGGVSRFFNFTLEGTSNTFSQNFTVSGQIGTKINITGKVNDTTNNFAINDTLFSITKDFVVTARNTYGNSTITAFDVTIFNSTTIFNIATTNGTITFPRILGTFTINISSDENGGYHNRTFIGYNTSIDMIAELYQSIAYFTAKRRGTSDNVASFEIRIPLAANTSNSSGDARLLMNATGFQASVFSDDFFDTTVEVNQTNQSTRDYIAQLYDINLTISVNSGINNTVLKNFTILLTGNNSVFSENLTAANVNNVTFSLGNNSYDIVIDAPQYALFFAKFFIGSNNTYPNLTFSLIGANSINFSIFDEVTEQLIKDNDTTIDLISDAFAINDSATDGGVLYVQDLIPGEYRVTYSHPKYTKRDFYVNVGNKTNQSVDLYLLSIGNGTAITFTVQDASGNKLSNATTRLKRHYISTNSYRTVAMSRTNEEGDTEIDVDFNGAFYETLTTFKEFSLRTVGARIISTTRILTMELKADPFSTIDGLDDIITSLTFNNLTQTFSYVFTQKSGLSTTGTLEVMSTEGADSSIVCTTTDTTSSGTLLCQVNTTNETGTYSAKGFVKVGNKNILTNVMNIITGLPAQFRDIIGRQGFFFAIMISGVLAGLGALVGPSVSIIMFGVGIVVSSFLGFSVLGATGIGTIAIIIMIMVWRSRS